MNVSKWRPSKIDQGIKMTRCDFVKNVVEVRSLKWWEKILHFRYIARKEKSMTGQGENTIRESERTKTMEGRAGIPLGSPNKPSKESIMESIDTTTNEMVTIATLKEAIANWLKLEDIYEYEDETSYYCLILGRLEMSLIRRKQSLDEDRKALEEL